MGYAISRRRASGLRRREALLGVLFISPWLVGFLALTLGPMAYSLYLSFTNYNIVRSPQFSGLANYGHIFTRDRLF